MPLTPRKTVTQFLDKVAEEGSRDRPTVVVLDNVIIHHDIDQVTLKRWPAGRPNITGAASSLGRVKFLMLNYLIYYTVTERNFQSVFREHLTLKMEHDMTSNINRRQFLVKGSITAMLPIIPFHVVVNAKPMASTEAIENQQLVILNNSSKFNGMVTDCLLCMQHLGDGYRAYNPLFMRFHAQDSMSPFGDGGINSYGYVAGDPLNYTDPTGHAPNGLRRAMSMNNLKTKQNKTKQTNANKLRRRYAISINRNNRKQYYAKKNNETDFCK